MSCRVHDDDDFAFPLLNDKEVDVVVDAVHVVGNPMIQDDHNSS